MIKVYQKGSKALRYKIIFKAIKNVYFRQKTDYVAITANKALTEKQVLAILDQNFDKISKFKEKTNRIKTDKFQLWGVSKSEATFYGKLEPTPKNFQKVLLDETVLKIKNLEPQLQVDLSRLGLKLKPTKVKLLKSKFGSCQVVKKEITINAFLAKLDPKYLYYVLLHEYCHLLVANHSSAFYKQLDKVLPNHKHIQKALRKYVITF